ncbi:MAG: hypothetical protein ABI591_22025 [Kofleriaceae bacterium]
MILGVLVALLLIIGIGGLGTGAYLIHLAVSAPEAVGGRGATVLVASIIGAIPIVVGTLALGFAAVTSAIDVGNDERSSYAR